MQPEMIPPVITGVALCWFTLRGLLWIGRIPMRRQQRKEIKEEWRANYRADQAALEAAFEAAFEAATAAAIAEFPGEAGWSQARSDELMKEARKILSQGYTEVVHDPEVK